MKKIKTVSLSLAAVFLAFGVTSCSKPKEQPKCLGMQINQSANSEITA